MDKEYLERMAEGYIEALGIDGKVKKDEDLLHYLRGKPMTLGDLRAIPLGSVVWLRVIDDDDNSVRVNAAYRLTGVDDDFFFGDGAYRQDADHRYLALDMENFGSNDEPAEDGVMTVYCAIQEQETCPSCKETLPEGWSVNNRGHKIEHVCSHGVGHTCAASSDDTTHGCDGCCAKRKDL
jgi:hypothetical protein